MTRFFDRLSAVAERNQSLLCVGLDPDLALMPLRDVYDFNKAIIDATKDLVCAYKPNVAFYDRLDESGHEALHKTVDYIRKLDIPVIGDSKRGDVLPTSKFHAEAMFDVWGFDAATINPYGGHDAVQPFLDYEDKGVFVWCRSSNPGAQELQDLLVVSREDNEEPRPFYEWVALRAAAWNGSHNVGLVVGAPWPHELKRIRDLCPDMPLLIPGVGAQRGPLELAVANGVDRSGRNAIVTVSRSILYAFENPKDFAEASRRVAEQIRELINGHLGLLGQPWEETAPSLATP